MKAPALVRFLPRLNVLGGALALPLSAQVAPPAPATPSAPPVELSVFEVTSARDIGYQSTHAAEVTRMNTAIGDIPMNVTILNQEFLEDTLARSTEDVLEYVPGFVATSNNDSWTVRGFANANTKFLNGFLQQESIGKVSLANVERVEVLKGPAAVLYGQGGYAATVNRVTKRPLPRNVTTFRGSYGPVESWRAELDTSGPVGSSASPVRYRVTAVYDDGYYYRRITHGEKAFSAIVSWQVRPGTRVSLEHLFVRGGLLRGGGREHHVQAGEIGMPRARPLRFLEVDDRVPAPLRTAVAGLLSLMPEGLEAGLTPQAVADLLDYILSAPQ